MRNESKDNSLELLKWDLIAIIFWVIDITRAPLTDQDRRNFLFLLKDLSKSISVGTRKMVNYG